LRRVIAEKIALPASNRASRSSRFGDAPCADAQDLTLVCFHDLESQPVEFDQLAGSRDVPGDAV
jgi:hypothetical protein